MNSNKIVINKHKVLAHLQHLPQPVSDLYISGDTWEAVLSRPRVAIVGSRRPTAYGRHVTNQLARGLAKHGIVVISGLALGIDSIAHQSVVETPGQTIAVLPSGVSRIYPASHQRLAERIVKQGGLLISEYPPSCVTPQKHQFIARNRIIAALSQAVIIPEAAERSGSLHTAQFALEQGQEVLVVPGNITSPLSAGTNGLLRAGATPVTELKDILDTLDISPQKLQPYIPQSSEERQLIAALQAGQRPVAELQLRSGLSVSQLYQTLTELELKEVIRQITPGTWILQ